MARTPLAQKLGEAVYARASAGSKSETGPEAGPTAGGPASGDENVVDAEFKAEDGEKK